MGDIFHALSTQERLSLWMFILPLCALFCLASCFCLRMINHVDSGLEKPSIVES